MAANSGQLLMCQPDDGDEVLAMPEGCKGGSVNKGARGGKREREARLVAAASTEMNCSLVAVI